MIRYFSRVKSSVIIPRSKIMSRLLIFDVESTGLPKKRGLHPSKIKQLPRVVQLGWMVIKDRKVLKERDLIIKPDGYTIPKESTKVHRIPHEKALREGRELKEVLEEFQEDVKSCDTLIAHNAEFDTTMVSAECYRMKIQDILKGRSVYCTMKSTIQLCALPFPNKKQKNDNDFKYPQLKELYRHLFNEDPAEDLHDALEDVKVTQKCWNRLRKMRDIEWVSHICR